MNELDLILCFIFGVLFMIGMVLNIRLIEIRDELRKMNARNNQPPTPPAGK